MPTTEELLSLGLKQMRASRYAEAVETYSELVKRDPDNPQFWLHYAQSLNYRSMRVPDLRLEAVSAASHAIELDSNSVDAYLERAYAYRAQEEHEKALIDYSHAIAIAPDNAKALCQRAITYEKVNSREMAERDYVAAATLRPGYIANLSMERFWRWSTRELPELISICNVLIQVDSSEIKDHYLDRADAFRCLGEFSLAEADCMTVIQLDPTYPAAYYRQGLVSFDRRQFRDAIASQTKAIELAPDFNAAYHERGNAKRATGEFESAIADYDEAIRIDPEDIDSFNGRGQARMKLGDLEGAISDFSESIRLYPKDPEAYEYRGRAYQEMGDRDAASLDFDKWRQLLDSG